MKQPTDRRRTSSTRRNGAGAAALTGRSGREPVPCMQCALCCTYVALEIEEPTTPRRATEILWYLYHRDTSVFRDGRDWFLQLRSSCRHLDNANLCDIYPRRPHICREMAETECEVNAAGEGQYFYGPEEYLEYLKNRRKTIYAAIRKRYLPPAANRSAGIARPGQETSFEKRRRRLRSAGFSAGGR